MNVEQLRRRGEALNQALGRESYQAGAGLVAETKFAEIFAAYGDLAGDEAWAAAAGHRELEEWVADAQIGRIVAPLDDRLHAWESAAECVLESGEHMPFQRAAIAIANEPDRPRRLAIDKARRALLGEPAAIRAERLAVERERLEALLGLGVVAARARLSGIALDALAAQARDFLGRTADVYRDELAERLRRELGVEPAGADRTDGSFLFRNAAFDEFFPREGLAATAIRQVGEMGLDALAAGRIVHDVEDRERKRARAFCAPVRVPEEVYLVIRPHGGSVDYRAFWHELGHALHFANMAAALAFEYRWLGDNSVTECFAMLFEHQLLAPEWLRRYAQMPAARLTAFRRSQAFALLAIIRRYAAKLNYEIALHQAPSLASGAQHYAEQLTGATGLRYADEDALLDLDDGFYAARYLRAWQFEAALREHLVERFDADWFRNPRSGPFLLDLFARGQRHNAAELAREVLGRELSFAPVVAWCEGVLDGKA